MSNLKPQIEWGGEHSEVERLRSEIARLREGRNSWMESSAMQEMRAKKAEAELAKAREALTFYRDGFRYHPKRSRTGVNLSEWRPTEELLADCGERARAAIQQEEKP